MKKSIIGIIAGLIVASLAFAGTSITKKSNSKADCCATGEACCYAGSPCCTK